MREMIYAKVFTANLSLLIALAYLFNIGYKWFFQHMSVKTRYRLTVAIFIVAGWLVMLFGVRLSGDSLLDLRFVPLIVAILVFPNAWVIAVIGAGIGIGRVFIGTDTVGWLAFLAMIVIGFVGMGMNVWLGRLNLRFLWKSVIAIVVVNAAYSLSSMLVVMISGVMSLHQYWHEAGAFALPIRVLLSCLLVFIIRDFQKEQMRVDELRTMNMLLRRQTRELREAKREVEEKARELLLASKYKSEFLANMSHELKTPLNSIILLSQLIRDNDDKEYGEEDLRYADLIHGAGNELLQLINDILDLSKVEAGKMDVVFEPLSTQDLLQMIQLQFAPVADQKDIAFRTEIAPNVPDTIRTDALRVNQILRNLLVNAFKFTEEGSVTLTVRLEAGSISMESAPHAKRRIRNWNPATWVRPVKRPIPPQRIAFTVEDTGIGIDPDKQVHIFEAFRQEDGAINRKYGGTGLGLSISLQLAKLLGGSLTLRSVKGQGSAFTLRIPVRPPGQGQAPASEGDRTSGTGDERDAGGQEHDDGAKR